MVLGGVYGMENWTLRGLCMGSRDKLHEFECFWGSFPLGTSSHTQLKLCFWALPSRGLWDTEAMLG